MDKSRSLRHFLFLVVFLCLFFHCFLKIQILLNGGQAKNQLKAYIRSGNFEYIVDYQKLLKDGVADPVKFVREEFQEVFRKNAQELFEQNETLFKRMEISPLQNIDIWERLEEVASDSEAFNRLIGEIFIKIE